MCYISAPILWLILTLCLSTGSLSKLRERSFANRLLFDTAFWMVSGCAIPGISLFLRHFHPSAKKNHPLAILSHNSVRACSTDSTCDVSVAKSHCRAGEGITNNLPARECLYPPAVPWDRAAFPLSCNCDTCCLITLFIWKIKSYHALKASPFLLLVFLRHVCSEARAQPCGSRAWPAAQQQGCLPHIALGSALPLLGEKLGLVKMFSAAGRCSSMLCAMQDDLWFWISALTAEGGDVVSRRTARHTQGGVVLWYRHPPNILLLQCRGLMTSGS